TQSSHTTKPEAEAIVRQLVLHSQTLGAKPKLPSATRQTEMMGLALKYGREKFWRVGITFLNEEPWLPSTTGFDIEWDSWRGLVEHFYVYEEKWQKRQAARAARQKAEEARLEEE